MVRQDVKLIDGKDNVATVLRNFEPHETAKITANNEELAIDVNEPVQFGHKIAISSISQGDTIYKYGKSIGNATSDISPGDWVHTHNVDSNYGRGDLAGKQESQDGE